MEPAYSKKKFNCSSCVWHNQCLSEPDWPVDVDGAKNFGCTDYTPYSDDDADFEIEYYHMIMAEDAAEYDKEVREYSDDDYI